MMNEKLRLKVLLHQLVKEAMIGFMLAAGKYRKPTEEEQKEM